MRHLHYNTCLPIKQYSIHGLSLHIRHSQFGLPGRNITGLLLFCAFIRIADCFFLPLPIPRPLFSLHHASAPDIKLPRFYPRYTVRICISHSGIQEMTNTTAIKHVSPIKSSSLLITIPVFTLIKRTDLSYRHRHKKSVIYYDYATLPSAVPEIRRLLPPASPPYHPSWLSVLCSEARRFLWRRLHR